MLHSDSSVTKIFPVDPKHPKIVQIKCKNSPATSGYVEFDTKESAHDWRNEIAGASPSLGISIAKANSCNRQVLYFSTDIAGVSM
jgi:hypothetical protein